MPLSQPRHSDPELDSELRKVAVETKAALRARYVSLFDHDPPRAFGPDLLRRSVAQRLQENAYGGLPKAMQRELDRLVVALIAKPEASLVVARRAQSGTMLVRDWKGKSHRVMITEEGFGYHGCTYSNLSEIARLITGTRWNGPRFFGLRRSLPKEVTEARLGQPPSVAICSERPSIASVPKRVRAGHGL